MKTPFGGACTDSSQCLSGRCLMYQGDTTGVCTAACQMSAECAALASGWWCLPDMNGGYCVTQCATSAECKAISPNWSCRNAFTAEGAVAPVCSRWLPGELGAPCSETSQCIAGACNGNWCAATCASDAECGNYAWCILNSGQVYSCFPACNTNDDCPIYGPKMTCQPTTSHDGRNASVCAYGG